jgi:AhpD family alkylhydroperoxidase
MEDIAMSVVVDRASGSDFVGVPVRLDIDTAAPRFSRAMASLDAAATAELDRVGIETPLRELVRIRASQVNGCAYCVSTHTTDARAAGVSEGRLTAVPVWRESPFFTARERAALEFTETVTRLSETHVPQEAWVAAEAEFTAAELGALVALIVTINAWNALAVTTRAWTPAL